MSHPADSLHAMEDFWAVVPAGGAGTRLWPLSRAGVPKFLLDITGSGSSLLQATVQRLAPLVADRVLVVTGAAHRDAVVAQLSAIAPEHVLTEPAPRDSMAAIGLAAAMLERSHPAAVMGSFAADHVIGAPEAFLEVVRTAVQVARENWLVTIGVQPTHPATGFGYIRVGDEVAGHPRACHVDAFVEKPSAHVARHYVESGQYRWNAGMFVVRPRVLLDLLAQTDPDFAADLRRIAAEPALVETLWPGLPRIAVDHAVAEPAAAAGRVVVVPGQFEWDDIGDFESLRSVLGQGDLAVLGDPNLVRTLDSGGLVIPGGNRMVTVIGLDNVVVVETADALLVTTTERAQDVKRMVTELAESGRDDLI